MARLIADKIRVEQGLTINEKLIPDSAVWLKKYGSFAIGDSYKANRLLSGGTGNVQGITIHNTDGGADAEGYTRATYPGQNMKDARVHYYVDDREAWQGLRENEVGWHAGDGRGSGNETTLAIEIIMRGSAIANDAASEENGALLAAILLDRHGLSIDKLYTHNHWMGLPDCIISGAPKNCPLYILPHWNIFKAKVQSYLSQIENENGQQPEAAPDDRDGKTAIMGKAIASTAQMVTFTISNNQRPTLPNCTLELLAEMFINEGEAEGVRGDIAFAQALLETGFFKYGGIVTPDMNNYGGIGALNGSKPGEAARFASPLEGVRAQIQHLKAYASDEELIQRCIDPRFSLVSRDSAPYVEWLGAADNPHGKGWAVPGKGYGDKIITLLDMVLATDAQQEDGLAWQREGFEALIKAGIITDPEYWNGRLNQPITTIELMGVLSRMLPPQK